MRGEAAEEDMDKIIEEFGQNIMDNLDSLPEIGPIVEPDMTTGSETMDNDMEDKTEIGTNDSDLANNDGDVPDDPLYIEPKETTPMTAPSKQTLRVQKNFGGSGGRVTAHQVTDGNFSELKIMEIEENLQPPRYPLRVGQIMGYEGFGCDILSFEDEEARDKFQSGEDRKISNISRFIEVKGRSNKGVEIELRGNAKDTAVKYKDRYYLYRLYKIDDGLYTLSILKNPIAAEEALEATVYVHIDRAKETETFEVSGGIVPAASAS